MRKEVVIVCLFAFLDGRGGGQKEKKKAHSPIVSNRKMGFLGADFLEKYSVKVGSHEGAWCLEPTPPP